MKGELLYVAGPMTNMPQFNLPAFFAAEADLVERGYRVQLPADLYDKRTVDACMASPDGARGSGSPYDRTWGDFLADDVKLIADVVDGVAVMDGWRRSQGARLEVFTCFLVGKPVYHYPSMVPLKPYVFLSQLLQDSLRELHAA